MRRVYDDDIDSVDLMIGLYAEPLPPGFGFSDTAFRIFILMASRRLKSDRFFTTDFTPRVYTQLGMDWIADNYVSRRSWCATRRGSPPRSRRVDNAVCAMADRSHSRRVTQLMPVTLDDLTTMSQAELDDLFRRSPLGDIPDGDAIGTAIVAPGTEITGRCHDARPLAGLAGQSLRPRPRRRCSTRSARSACT